MPEKYYEAPGAIRRLPGESFASFAARQKASQSAGKPAVTPKRRQRTRMHRETYEDRLDDLGPSPDY